MASPILWTVVATASATRSRRARRASTAPVAIPLDRYATWARLCEPPIELAIALVAIAVPIVVVPYFTVPFDVPQVNLLKATTGVAIIFAAIRWGLLRLSSTPGTRLPQPVLYAFLSFGAVNAFSTVFSISPEVSFWGNYPDQHGTYALLQLCYLALALIVGCHLWRPEQRTRVAIYLATGGIAVSTFGILQFAGRDPYGLSPVGGRIIATLGNAIFVGGFLVITTTFTAILASRAVGSIRDRRPARSYAATVLAFIALALQLTAMLLTQSRGPFLGLAVAAVVTIGVAAWVLGPRHALVLTLSMAAGAVCALGILQVLPGAGEGVLATSGQRIASVGEFAAGALPVGAPTELTRPELGGESFLARLRTWEMGWGLALRRPWVPFDPDLPYPVRALLGYGPDTSRTVNRMGASPELLRLHPGSISYYMHNLPLQVLSDLGWLGLLTFCALVGAVLHRVVLALRLLRSAHMAAGETTDGATTTPGWILAAVAGAIAGHLAEQLTGVPVAPTDAAFWLIIGLAAGAARSASRPRGERHLRWQLPTVLAMPGLALLLTAGMSLSAEWRASAALQHIESGDAVAGERLLKEASDIAPWPPYYELLMGAMYSNAAPRAGDPTAAGRLTMLAATYLDAVLRQDPWNVTARSVRAWTDTILGVNERTYRDAAKRRYEEILALTPSFDDPAVQYANALILWGEPDAALELLDRQIHETSVNPDQAVVIRARAHHAAGRLEEAISTLEPVMRNGPAPEIQSLYAALVSERTPASRTTGEGLASGSN